MFDTFGNLLGYSKIEMYVKPEKGIFCQFLDEEDKQVYLMTTNPYLYKEEDELIQINGFISGFIDPEYETNSQNLNINSGNVLYLENIRYISLTDDQSIEANIVLEF